MSETAKAAAPVRDDALVYLRSRLAGDPRFTEIQCHRWAIEAVVQQVATLTEAVEHTLAVLPEPLWNDRRVLVWSMLDIERLTSALAALRGETARGN